MAVFPYENRLISSLEEMAGPLMALIKELGGDSGVAGGPVEIQTPY
jgi:hypothetical protein